MEVSFIVCGAGCKGGEDGRVWMKQEEEDTVPKEVRRGGGRGQQRWSDTTTAPGGYCLLFP